MIFKRTVYFVDVIKNGKVISRKSFKSEQAAKRAKIHEEMKRGSRYQVLCSQVKAKHPAMFHRRVMREDLPYLLKIKGGGRYNSKTTYRKLRK